MSDRQQTTLGIIGYLFIGTAAILLPSVMPSITAEFSTIGLTLTAIGLIFPAGSVGGILGNLLAGIGSDLIGRQRLVWLSALLLAGSLALVAVTKVWVLFVVGYAVVSAAQGSLSTGINALVADANRDARAKALNILHGVYGVGATISPLIIGYFIAGGLTWRWALAGTGIIWLVYSIAAYLFYQASATTQPTSKVRKVDFAMLRQRPFLALFVIGFIYNGVAVSLLGWVAVIAQQSAGLSVFFAVSMISIFYVALTVGRFLCAAYAERLGYATILLILALGITLTYPLVVLGIHSSLLVLGVFLTGLSFSGLFPMALAFGSRLYPEQSGTLSGTLSVALTLGSMIPPLWTALIAEGWNFQIALAVNYLMVLPLIFLARYLGRVEINQMLCTK